MQLAFGIDHSVLLTPGHEVFTAGDNLFGQLLRADGPGFVNTTLSATSVVCDQNTTYLLRPEGVYSSGPYQQIIQEPVLSFAAENLQYSWVTTDGTAYHSRWGLLPFQVGAVKVQCGFDFTLILLENGEVYGLGDNSSGQLGLGLHHQSTRVPMRIPVPPCVDVVVGEARSFFLTESGELYVTGSCLFGELGIGSAESIRYSPTRIVTRRPITAVACGNQHSLLLDVEGKLWSAGDNRKGQCGATSQIYDRSVFFEVPMLEPLVELFAGGDCSGAVGASGRLYGWGRNDSGQLGIHDPPEYLQESEFIYQPVPLE